MLVAAAAAKDYHMVDAGLQNIVGEEPSMAVVGLNWPKSSPLSTAVMTWAAHWKPQQQRACSIPTRLREALERQQPVVPRETHLPFPSLWTQLGAAAVAPAATCHFPKAQ